MKQALCYLLLFLGLQMIVAGATELIVNPTESLLPQVIALGLTAVVTIALFVSLRWATPSRQYIMTLPWTTLCWSAVAAVGAIIPSVFVQEFIAWPESILKMFHAEETTRLLNGIMATTGGFFVVAILQPLAEEVVFRGAILRALLAWQPRRRWLMILLSALLFALAHMNPMQFIHPLLVGVLLGWMYERTHSIVPGVVYHWVNNSVAAIATIYFVNDDSMTLADLWGPQRVYLAVAFSLLILVPAIYQLNQSMKRQ